MEFNPPYRHISNEKVDDDKDEEEEEEEEEKKGNEPCRLTSGVRTIYFPIEAFGVNIDALVPQSQLPTTTSVWTGTASCWC